mgnify:CR=1 FL=1
MGKSIADFHFVFDELSPGYSERLTKEIESERNLEVTPDGLLLPQMLNSDKKHAYDLIIKAYSSVEGQAFFVDGPGGTGKTFLYRALLATL